EEARLAPDREARAPFATKAVQLGPRVGDSEIEEVVALEVVREREAHLQIVRPPAAIAYVQIDAGQALGSHELIVHGLEQLEPVDAVDIPAQRHDVERLADLDVQLRGDRGVGETRLIVDVHEV